MKRFYTTVEIIAEQGRFLITLDGKLLRTPARNIFELENSSLAEAVQKEWQDQEEFIIPQSMPFTKLINSALDGGEKRQAQVVDDIVRYAGSDLLCYRADTPEELAQRQKQKWDPVLNQFAKTFGIYFSVTENISFIPQSCETLQKVRKLIMSYPSFFSLYALHSLTTLSGSVILALSIGKKLMSSSYGWELAHLDETYQETLWGIDKEAEQRRNNQFLEFCAATRVLEWI